MCLVYIHFVEFVSEELISAVTVGLKGPIHLEVVRVIDLKLDCVCELLGPENEIADRQ